MKEDKEKFPSAIEFYKNIPLYKSYRFDDSNYEDIIDIQFYMGPIDLFCKECNQKSIFKLEVPKEVGYGKLARIDISKMKGDMLTHKENVFRDRTVYKELFCSRDILHSVKFYIEIFDNAIMKIGQYPSYADLHDEDYEKYRKVLADKYIEYKKAIGLYSHGIGIGSYVYLRRIFEELIIKTYEAHKDCLTVSREDYLSQRMDDKIAILKNYLPKNLIENKKIYSILSKGIHSLSENECLEYFNIIKIGIEIILDEKIEMIEKQKKEELVRKEINKISLK